MSAHRLLAAASRADDFFAGRLGACVPTKERAAILAELSAAVAEAKAEDALGRFGVDLATALACEADRRAGQA